MNEDRFTAGTFNITGEAQHQRRLELERWRRGDRSVPGPANMDVPPWEYPTKTVSRYVAAPTYPSDLRPMYEAPRDGSHLRLYRKPHPNLKHPVVIGYWKQWSAHHGFWNSALGVLGGDEFMIGWIPL